jgi:predicted RNA-binding Zn-ribbon protein involved in translation (DUF1610 family)
MIQDASNPAPTAAATTAPCPKCGTTMVLAAVTPHPIVPHMKRHTFLCAKCNQTKTYMLKVGDDMTHDAVSKSRQVSPGITPIVAS